MEFRRLDEVWHAVLKRSSQRIGAKSYRDWFEPTRLLPGNGMQLAELEVPNTLFKEWMDRNYKSVVEEVLAEFAATSDPSQAALPVEVRFVVAGAEKRLRSEVSEDDQKRLILRFGKSLT